MTFMSQFMFGLIYKPDVFIERERDIERDPEKEREKSREICRERDTERYI